MNSKRLAALFAFSAFISVGTAEAQTVAYTSGAACQLVQTEAPATLGTPPYGIGILSTSASKTVNCALDSGTVDVGRIQLYAFDRSTVANVSCVFSAWDGS